jgi:hypothetical protein
VSINKLKFLNEIHNMFQSDPEGKLFDSMGQALKYSQSTGKPAYALVWEDGKILYQYKIELRGELTSDLLSVIYKTLEEKFKGKGVFYTNYPSSLLSSTRKLIIKDKNFIKFLEY